jgi:hypothetical protein
MPNRGMNQEQQRKRRNPTNTAPDDDEAQEADVTGADSGKSTRQRGSQVAADTEDADIEGEDSGMDEDDVDDADDADDDEEPIGGRV